jgi:hypothetical protein|tara:strand:- start:11054 stop:11254 length:201 start_codon:yes stop_codon:yes gene_type:complete
MEGLKQQEIDRLDRRISGTALLAGLSVQEARFLARTAAFWGLPSHIYIRALIRSGGDPFLPSRREC